MEDYMKEALEIVKAQAAHRMMSADEITSMVKTLSASLSSLASGGAPAEVAAPAIDGKKSIKEKSVTCLECGKVMKVITSKHLATHGVTPDEYKVKFGIKKGTALAAKSLVKARKAKMQDMKLWERRKKKVETPAS